MMSYTALLVVSLNITIGFAGIINLAHVAFFGIGAYAGTLVSKAGHGFGLALLAGIAAGLVVGWLVSKITRRLKGDYVALGTLAVSFVVYSLLLNMKDITGGPFGLYGISRPTFLQFIGNAQLEYFIIMLSIAAVVIYAVSKLMKSRYGKLLEATRDDEIGAMMLGKNVYKLKDQSMMLAAGIAGLAGVLFAHFLLSIHPNNFFLSDIILLLCMLIIGGLGSIRGSVVGTIVLILITESLRFLPLAAGYVGTARLMVYAVLLLVVLLYRPRGLFGRIDLQ